MPGDQTTARGDILSLTSEIVAAHVGNNSVGTADLTQLIQVVFDTLNALANEQPTSVVLTPAVPIRKSVTDDYLVCLEDGKKLKMLRRHLMTQYDMSPEEYRAKWGLKPDYPMVAPNYARKRQELAKQFGLGRKRAPAPKGKVKRSRGRSAAR
jgi:predicted transcriptional regulator